MKHFILGVVLLLLGQVACNSQNDPDNLGFQDQKSQLLLSKVADKYKPPSRNIGDPEKYYWPVVIARFELYGIGDSIANKYLQAFKERSPFHFTLVGMARIMSAYGNSEVISENKTLLLKKVFERDDSLNPWTTEGTENHINMSKTSGYLFAQHALDFPEDFPDAPQKLEKLKEWMKWWSQQIYKTGPGEWNSSIYEAYNIMGWLNLYDFAKDPEVKKMARAVLDFYATEMALHYSFGVTGGAEMRGNGVNLDGTSATAYYHWYWFSKNKQPVGGLRGSQYIQAAHVVTSDYSPPRAICDLALSKSDSGAYYNQSRPSYLFRDPFFAKLTYYKEENFTVGNCVSNYGGFTGGAYQIVPWKIVVDQDSVPLVVSGNGVFFNEYSGKTRNPFTQSVQHKNAIIQMTMVPKDAPEVSAKVDEMISWWSDSTRQDLKQRFPSETHRIKGNLVNAPSNRNYDNRSFVTFPRRVSYKTVPEGYLFSLSNEISIFVGALNPENDSVYIKDERLIIESYADYGEACGFVVEVLRGQSLLKAKKNRLIAGKDWVEYINVAGDSLKMAYQRRGKYIEPLYDWGYGPVKPQLKQTSPPFKQPDWPACNSCGRIPSLWVNGEQINYGKDWPVITGPGVQLKNSMLVVSSSGNRHVVDYSGDVPVFR